MKRSIITKTIVAAVAALGVCTYAHADLLYTFDTGKTPVDTGTPGGNNAAWTSGTIGWSSAQQASQILQPGGTGGWTLGGANGGKFEFSWPSQSAMWAYDNSGAGVISFDIGVTADDSYGFYTYHTEGGNWVNLWIASNSGGTQGWTQQNGGAFTVDPNNLTQWFHVEKTFAQMGWNEGGATDGWYQIFFGPQTANSDQVLQVLIDNVQVTPEPTTLALAGLGAAALLIFRRRS